MYDGLVLMGGYLPFELGRGELAAAVKLARHHGMKVTGRKEAECVERGGEESAGQAARQPGQAFSQPDPAQTRFHVQGREKNRRQRGELQFLESNDSMTPPARPTMRPWSTGPKARESRLRCRLSPRTK